MRNLLISFACFLLLTGLVVAAEVTLVKYDTDKKEVTVKEGDAEKTYKLTDKTKVYVVKDGKNEDSTVDTAIKLLSNEKAKGKLKFELTAENDSIREIKLRPRKGK
jgi:CBS domain containing-hemolysin-like protein